jgi:hypothetical protein
MALQVVNKLEVDALANVGVPFFGINIAVGLSIPLSGVRTDIMNGLLAALPQVLELLCAPSAAASGFLLRSDQSNALA